MAAAGRYQHLEEKYKDLSGLPQWVLEKIPLIYQSAAVLCQDDKYNENMKILSDMKIEAERTMQKCGIFIDNSHERMESIKSVASSVTSYGKSAEEFAEESRTAQDKASEVVEGTAKKLRWLWSDIHIATLRMSRFSDAQGNARPASGSSNGNS
ncbi:MAG: hypothetical protein Q9169_003707 [Polycauliona sp. 2 TL-2023]